MPKAVHIALLRGINVAGKNRLPMKVLVEMFEQAGCGEVRTYIQSGNVVFRASKAKAISTCAGVRQRIGEELGLEIPLVLRSAAELRAAVAGSPFVSDCDADTLHVGFLANRPSAKQIASLDPTRSPGDRFAVVGREIHMHCPNGIGGSKLTNDWFDRSLATVTTVRNWKTVQALLEMSE